MKEMVNGLPVKGGKPISLKKKLQLTPKFVGKYVERGSMASP